MKNINTDQIIGHIFGGGDSNSPCHDNRSTALAGEVDKFWWSLFGRYMNDVDKTTLFTLYFTKLH